VGACHQPNPGGEYGNGPMFFSRKPRPRSALVGTADLRTGRPTEVGIKKKLAS
jgi:hypothetical protein